MSMVLFSHIPNGREVLVDGKTFGYLQKGDGFSTGEGVIKGQISVSSYDLILIARHAAEVNEYGDKIPRCSLCGGTPAFISPHDTICENRMHQDFEFFND